MTRRRRLLVVVPVLIALGAAGAYAYFTTTGSGVADASTGTLAAPSISNATPGAGTVALTWSPVTAPAGGTVAYFVSRDGGAPAGNCPSSTSPTSGTSCTDSGLAAGSHSYTVTAVWRSWTAAGTATNVTVDSGAATHLVLAAATTTPTAGAADNLTITAKDAANVTVTSYSGDKSLTFSGAGNAPDGTHPTVSNKTGTATNFGSTTTITFASGVATVSGSSNGVMRLYKPETAAIAVSDGSIGGSLPVTVSPAAAATLTVSGYPTPTVAGVGHSFTVTAKDAFGNTATGYAGTVAFSASNDGAAVLPANSTLTSGTGTFNATFKTVAGGSKALTATDTSNGSITGSQTGISVTPAAATTLQVGGYPASTTAGISNSFTVTAKDPFGNTDTGYAGTVKFTATNDAVATLPSNSTLTAGTGTFSATFRTVAGGNKTLTATDTVTPAITGSQTGISVNPATAATLLVSGYVASTVAGVSHPFTVTAQDAFGNTATGYSGPVAFTATNDAAAALPANSTLTSGTGTFSATFKTVAGGTKTLTATDTTTSSISGSQAGISVTPAAASTVAVVSGSGQSAGVSTAFANLLVASVSDAFSNPVSGASVSFAAPATGASGTFAAAGCTGQPPASTCVATTGANGQATTSTFTANATAGSYNVTATVAGVGSVTFSLANVASDTFSVSVPSVVTAGTSASVTITAKAGTATDTSYTGTKCLTFSGPTNSPNNTAPSYPAPSASCVTGESAVTFTAGVATPSVTLTRATGSTTLTATQGAITGTSATFAVNSAAVALSYSSCPTAPVVKSSTTNFAILVPLDTFANAFTRSVPLDTGLTLNPSDGFVFSGGGTTATVSIASGPLNNTFSVIAPAGAKKTATLSATTPGSSGFTAPANCSISTP